MTELEIKILANKTYDSMVSQMRNIPGTTDKEIDIFMDKFTKNLREILIKENPEDSGILHAIIMKVLDMINCPWMPYYPVTQNAISATIFEYNIAANDVDKDRIINDIIHNSEDIIDRMKYLSLVFTVLFINKETINDYCDLDASRIISVSPLSYKYKEKLKYLMSILISYHTDYNDAIDRKFLSDAIQAEK